jgi:hypothetical protein
MINEITRRFANQTPLRYRILFVVHVSHVVTPSMSAARTARFALVVAFLAACATAALADYFDPVQTYSSIDTDMTSDRYLGTGTAIADGRVIFPPAIGGKVGIYDPSTETLTLDDSPEMYISGSYRYYFSVLMLDGRVCFIPYWRTDVAVFDPDSHTLAYFEIPTDLIAHQKKYLGGATANDGRVVMAPAYETGVLVFDPSVDQPTFVKYGFGDALMQASMPYYEGAAKAGNGKIIFAPYFQATPVGIFDPLTNTFSTASHGATSANNVVFSGAAAAYGGKVVLAPYFGDSVGVYDPDTDKVTSTPHNLTADTPHFYGAASRAYDSNVIFTPHSGNEIGVFDVRDNSLTTHSPTGLPTGTGMFWSPTPANATRILLVGRTNSPIRMGIFDIETCDPWPNTMIQSIGRCGVPPCESPCDLAMREMGLLVPCV